MYPRNYWIELEVDGRKTKVETGPAKEDGGFKLKVYMRDKEGVVAAAQLNGLSPDSNGDLYLEFMPYSPTSRIENTGYVQIKKQV